MNYLPFLLEIGTEEIPDWMIVPALGELRRGFEALTKDHAISGGITVDATPRRLVLRVPGIVEGTPEMTSTTPGPYKSAGAGAAAGFAKKWGTTVEELGTQSTPKGEQYLFTKRTQGEATSKFLARELPNLILKIQWPKTMVWNGKGTERFIRPIRWLVALLGNAVVPFEISGVKSSNITVGHRVLGKSSIPVSIQDFDQQLKTNGVILSADERESKIKTGVNALLRGTGLFARKDPDLLQTLIYITELPAPILGDFDRSYLSLPQEVLITVMRHHQKYLSVVDSDGNLAPHFIAVMNIDADPDGLVRQGNERVLRARFNDARFFWNQDQKKKLEDRVEDLKNVTFQAKLGSYYDKTRRVVKLVAELGGNERAALLCKCDLTTDMVKEFTDLQGIVGGLYARAHGEPDEVAQAIYDHYKPVGVEDDIPSTAAGQILSLADKWDTLVECFKVGMIPTGSRDPFGLRRAAQGVVRIAVKCKMKFDFPGMSTELAEFMRDRIEYYFRDLSGYAYDEVRACMAAGWTDLIDLEARLRRVQEVRATPDFEPLAASFKRIKNILKQANFTQTHGLYTDQLEEGPERALYAEYDRTRYEPLEARIASLRPRIDLFFDKVLVNVPDETKRRNRLTLLQNLLDDFSRLADFSEIVTERQS